MKIEQFDGFKPEFLVDLTTIADATQSSWDASRVVITPNTEEGSDRTVKSVRCRYHILQLVMYLFTKIVSCFFSKAFKDENSITAQWLIDSFGEDRLRRICGRYKIELFELNRDNGLPLPKRDLRLIFSALTVVTKSDISEIFNDIKSGHGPGYLTEDAKTILAERFRGREFTTLDSTDFDVLVNIANPFASLKGDQKNTQFLHSPPSYTHPSLDRGKDAQTMVQLANEYGKFHSSDFSEMPNTEMCAFMKRVNGWYLPDGTLFKTADGVWRALEKRICGGGVHKVFYYAQGRVAGMDQAPHLMTILQTQAMGTAPNAFLSIEADFDRETGGKGFMQTYRATRRVFDEIEGSWMVAGYSLGGAVVSYEVLSDLCETQRRIRKFFQIANPGVSNETIVAFSDMVHALDDFLPRPEQVLMHNIRDATSCANDGNIGRYCSPDKLCSTVEMSSAPGGFNGDDPAVRAFRTGNTFTTFLRLFKSIMLGPHHAVPDTPEYEVEVYSNQNPGQRRVMDDHLLNNRPLGWGEDIDSCAQGRPGTVLEFLRVQHRNHPDSLIHKVDLTFGGRISKYRTSNHQIHPGYIDELYALHATRVGQ